MALTSCCGLLLFLAASALAFDNAANNNLAVYYGQNSYGATHGSDTANWQQPLSHYCQDDTINAIPLAFLTVFNSTGGAPEIDLSNTCTSNSGVFPGTKLANCQFMASDIQGCQSKGKIVTLSLGGQTGAATLSSDDQGRAFADTIWNLFLGGSSSTRPFGDAVLDGVDLDIESGGSTGFAAFVQQLQSHMNSGSKKYYITSAPQCPFPDANLGAVLNAVPFDAVYIQFYNNYCGLGNFSDSNAWNFGQWDSWAKNTSPNKNVKIYIGAPASQSAAGSGYVDAGTLANIIQQTRSQYSSFGGVMLWDASQAYANNRFDIAVKNALGGSTSSSPANAPPPPPPPSTGSPPSSNPAQGSCAGVATWNNSVAYNGGSQVTYNGHLWSNKWWSFGDTPGGAAGVWVDNGACSSAKVKATAKLTPSAVHVKASPSATHIKSPASVSHANKSIVKVAPSAAATGERKMSRFFKY